MDQVAHELRGLEEGLELRHVAGERSDDLLIVPVNEGNAVETR